MQESVDQSWILLGLCLTHMIEFAKAAIEDLCTVEEASSTTWGTTD